MRSTLARKTFAAGLLADLIAALRRSRPGDLLAITSGEASVGADLEAWCRFTGNTLVDTSVERGPHSLGDPVRRSSCES